MLDRSYCIEDIDTNHLPEWERKVPQWRQIYPNFMFNIYKINNILNKSDNNMIIIYLPPKI